ncbi:carbonic anhydrase [Halobacteriovorax marinus]|uniref:Carbonic anhydrase 2 n=1 Tax=Halobacteriovorax marinus TaxID=97084 RepID=A0A1Y5FHH0_9BACT|nr:carbonic anhydrase [Halobacteriovorax marinus]
MDISKVFKNNEKWISERISEDKDYFKTLSAEHNPEILYIGCSDSRVTAEELMGLEPGEAFIHRNVANMVVSIDLNVMTVINYAVTQLKVKHVVVCGHYGCGGIKAALENKDQGILNPWLRNIRDVYRIHKTELNAITSEHEKYKRLVELNVQEQCINLIKTAAVQHADHTRGIKVHGWVFDMETGKLIDLKIDFNKIIKEIEEIYKLES